MEVIHLFQNSGTTTISSSSANVIKQFQERFQAVIAGAGHDEQVPEDQGDQTHRPISLVQGKGRSSKGPNGGKGRCVNCCEFGHVISQCDRPRKNGADKGIGKGKGTKGTGLNALVGMFKAVGSQMPPINDKKSGGGTLSLIRATRCFTKGNFTAFEVDPQAIPCESFWRVRLFRRTTPDATVA